MQALVSMALVDHVSMQLAGTGDHVSIQLADTGDHVSMALVDHVSMQLAGTGYHVSMQLAGARHWVMGACPGSSCVAMQGCTCCSAGVLQKAPPDGTATAEECWDRSTHHREPILWQPQATGTDPVSGSACLRPVHHGPVSDAGVFGAQEVAGGGRLGACGAHWNIHGRPCECDDSVSWL